jgi:peptide/nickel transport system substrate-binding protein
VPNVLGGGPLADVRVRQALLKAVDRKSYASTIFWDDYPVVASPLEASTPGFTDLSAALAHDAAGAGDLLDQAGWTLGSDGYRHNGGRKLTLVTLLTANSDGAQLLQDQLKDVGIELQLDVVTSADRLARLKAGTWDLVENYYTRADASILASVLDVTIAIAPPGSQSQDPQTAAHVSDLFAQGLSTTDDDARNKVYAQLQQYILDQAVGIPLYERLQVSGLSGAVQGFAWTSESFLRANDIWKSA